MLKVSTFCTTKMRKVLFLGSSTTWEVPSGVDYCTARICGGGGGGAGAEGGSAGANSTVSCGDGTFRAVGSEPVTVVLMGVYGTCRTGREFSGQSAFFASGADGRSFTGMIPAAVNEFGINLIPGETVTITVGAGGARGWMYEDHPPGPGSNASGGSGFVNIEYYI